MKVAFYLGPRRPWYIGIGNVLVRLRLRSQISHCEVVFEPGDGVSDLMPNALGLWCASASASDVIPAWSPRRAGRRGGVRVMRLGEGDKVVTVARTPRGEDEEDTAAPGEEGDEDLQQEESEKNSEE